MRPFRFNICNFCCLYLLNNKKLECRFAWINRCYTQLFRYFCSIFCCNRYWFERFSCFWLNLLLVAGFFLFNVLSKKVLIWSQAFGLPFCCLPFPFWPWLTALFPFLSWCSSVCGRGVWHDLHCLHAQKLKLGMPACPPTKAHTAIWLYTRMYM